MISTSTLRRVPQWAFWGTALCASAVLAANTPPVDDALARYRQEMAACEHITTPQDKASCRLEARNALTEARRGALNQVLTPAQYQANALQRCAVHQEEGDRAACEARMRGEGRVDGSVGQGGLLRELETPAVSR